MAAVEDQHAQHHVVNVGLVIRSAACKALSPTSPSNTEFPATHLPSPGCRRSAPTPPPPSSTKGKMLLNSILLCCILGVMLHEIVHTDHDVAPAAMQLLSENETALAAGTSLVVQQPRRVPASVVKYPPGTTKADEFLNNTVKKESVVSTPPPNPYTAHRQEEFRTVGSLFEAATTTENLPDEIDDPSSCVVKAPRCLNKPKKKLDNTFTGIYQEEVRHSRDAENTERLNGIPSWSRRIAMFMQTYRSIKSIAEFPVSGSNTDGHWSLPGIQNTDMYFGGDISSIAAKENHKRFYESFTIDKKEHMAMRQWDLETCGVPKWYTSCNGPSAKQPFDLISINLALQMMNISTTQQLLRYIILESGATWFAVSSFRQDDKTSPSCASPTTACNDGNIESGDLNPFSLQCQPFNFPRPQFTFRMWEKLDGAAASSPYDMQIYRIDAALRTAARGMFDCHQHFASGSGSLDA